MKLFNTPEGKIIVSILWGLGVATLFRGVCKDCIIVQSEDPEEVSKKTYKFNDTLGTTKCVQFKPKFVSCNTNQD